MQGNAYLIRLQHFLDNFFYLVWRSLEKKKSTHRNRSSNQSLVRVFIPPAASPSGLSSSRKHVHVKGYTRSNGTHVDTYTRSSPSPKGSSKSSSVTASHSKSGSFSSVAVANGYSLLAKLPSPGNSRSVTCGKFITNNIHQKTHTQGYPCEFSSPVIMTTGDGTQL